jgi:dsRNA-specific ribonuclease
MHHSEQYLDTYFVPRNGIKINPQRDVNYNIETLTYMTAAGPADKITSLIINYQRAINNIPFVVYEPCAGIGGNTVSFLNKNEISFVHSFERVPQRQSILTTNVTAYKLSPKWDLRADFLGVSPDEKKYVVYFDPPWLPEGISGLKFDKSQYILKDAMVGPYTIEQWLTHLTGATMVVYRVPPGYSFKAISGWTILVNDDLNQKKNARLIIALNNNYYNSIPNIRTPFFINDTYTKSKNEIKTKNVSIYSELSTYEAGTETEQKEEPKVEQKIQQYSAIVQKPALLQIPNLPTQEGGKIPALFSKKVTKINNAELEKVTTHSNQENRVWKDNLFNFLRNFLFGFIQNEEVVMLILSGENENTWMKAFTHKSYDPIQNYDVLEFLGDSAAELMFKQYVSERFSAEIEQGIIGEAGITNLKNTYMSKIFQSQIGNDLEFPKYVRSLISVNVHIAEDLVESFTGALMKTANNVKPAMGYVLVYNFIIYIFENREIELTYIFGPAKTQIQQFFSGLGWGPSPVVTRGKSSNGGEVMKLLLTDIAKRNLQELKKSVHEVIGIGNGNTDRMAEANAYDSALKYFISIGLDHDWLQSQKHIMEFNEIDHPEYTGLINKLYGKMMQMGIIRLEFVSYVISEGRYLLELHGHRAGTEKSMVLVSGITNEVKGKHEADSSKVRLLENFLKL